MPAIKIKNDLHWHDLRKNHIGASEVAALFGASPYQTIYGLYETKKNYPFDDVSCPHMDLGTHMEPFIANRISKLQGWKVQKCCDYLSHPKHKHLGATLDYYVVDSEEGKGILEIKNVNSFNKAWSDTRAPDYIEWQAQHQLLVANAECVERGDKPFEWCVIGSLHGGNPDDIRLMRRHVCKEAHEAIIDYSSKFWSDLKNDTPPTIDEGCAYADLKGFFQHHPPEDDNLLDLMNNSDVESACNEYMEKKEQINKLEKDVSQLKERIIHNLIDGDKSYNCAKTNGFLFSFKESTYVRNEQPAKEVSTMRFNLKKI